MRADKRRRPQQEGSHLGPRPRPGEAPRGTPLFSLLWFLLAASGQSGDPGQRDELPRQSGGQRPGLDGGGVKAQAEQPTPLWFSRLAVAILIRLSTDEQFPWTAGERERRPVLLS